MAVTDTMLLEHMNVAGNVADSVELALSKGWDHQKLVGIISSLKTLSMVTTGAETIHQTVRLTDAGKDFVQKGSPEGQVYNAVVDGETTVATLEAALGKEVAKAGHGAAMKNKWLALDKATKTISKAVPEIQDAVQAQLAQLEGVTLAQAAEICGGEKAFDALKKRKPNMVAVAKATGYEIQKGDKFSTTVVKQATDITAAALADGSWQTADLKPYNLNAVASIGYGGNLNLLLKMRQEFRKNLLYMGFEEMEANKWVESSFWNFDTLFQPQQHPARDAHDTFFTAPPEFANMDQVPKDYLERVREMHEKGGCGSIGWRYDWSAEEASKNILRTHTTAVSSRTLYKLAQDYQKECEAAAAAGQPTPDFPVRKFFSIDRVFRNETLDATHLAEFHQVEGFVIGRNLGLGNLIAVIKEFFRLMGITRLRFKPAYNPYTEPSMEVFGYSDVLKKWCEIGNSGIFRPEMLRPMGFPEDIRVIAWGLSVERPTMILYNLGNIRELFGHKLDVAQARHFPVVQLKEGEKIDGIEM